MASKADILASLRQSVAAIERGEPDPGVVAMAVPGASVAPPAPSVGQGPCPCRPTEDLAGDGTSAAAEGKTADDAFRKILRWVSVRERSTAYLRQRLLKDEFPPEAVEEALERALRVHAVDDRRYGDALIRMRLAAGRGLRPAEEEIEELGIDPRSLDAWREHAEGGREAEVDRALALLRRRPPRAKRAREAAFRKLCAQGFPTDIAASAARQWAEAQPS